MRIAHIFWQVDPAFGGVEQLLVDEFRCFATSDIHFILLGTCDPAYNERLGSNVTVHELNRKAGSGILGLIPVFFKLNILLLSIRPNLIVVHALELIRLILLRKAPIVGHAHNMNTSFNKKMLGRYDSIIAVSEAVKEGLVCKCGADEKKVKVIYNAIDCGKFVQKEKLVKRDGPFKIVQIGRLCERVKGQDLLLEAVAGIKGFDVDVAFIGDGEDRKKLEEKAVSLGLQDKVSFTGQLTREDVYGKLSSYDLLVLPSRHEGLGNVLLEAMASRLPFLCSNVDGPKELIEKSGDGYVFASEDVLDLRKKIEFLCQEYASLDMKGKLDQGFSFVHDNCDLNVMKRLLSDLYEGVLE